MNENISLNFLHSRLTILKCNKPYPFLLVWCTIHNYLACLYLINRNFQTTNLVIFYAKDVHYFFYSFANKKRRFRWRHLVEIHNLPFILVLKAGRFYECFFLQYYLSNTLFIIKVVRKISLWLG